MIKTDYTVIDDFLPREEYIKIRDILMSNEIPWYFQKETTYFGKESLHGEYYFTHVFYINHNSHSNFFTCLEPLITKIDPAALIRVKGNLFPNLGKILENDTHTDHEFKNNGAVYSINTCNGFTRLADGTKIESVANRLLIFRGDLTHNSSHCTDEQRRVNINLNYIPKEFDV